MKIELNPEDVKLLYGDHIWLVPENKDIPEHENEGKELTSKVVAPQTEAESHAEADKASETPSLEKKPEKKEAETSAEPGIRWIPKADSRVLFVLQNDEMKNKALTALLRKIVESLDIPFEAAGFGVIDSSPQTADWEAMPNPIGVVFDRDLAFTENPFFYGERELYFAWSLAELEADREKKMELWGYLKTVKERL